MFANLSSVLLYVWVVRQGLSLPWYIPLLLMLRNAVLLTPPGSLSRKLLILTGVPVTIEYVLAIASSLFMLGYLAENKNRRKKESVTSTGIQTWLYWVIGVFVLLLLCQAWGVLLL